MSSDSHPTKKIKTAPAGTPIFSDLDLARLTFDATPHGAEIKHATVKYGGERLAFQLSNRETSLRAPFGLDDGSKFGGKPSLNIEMPKAQLAFFRGGIEAAVKEAAVKNKEAWFGAIRVRWGMPPSARRSARQAVAPTRPPPLTPRSGRRRYA